MAQDNRQRGNNDRNGGPVGGRLNSDNSYSDKGLKNERLTKKAVKTTR